MRGLHFMSNPNVWFSLLLLASALHSELFAAPQSSASKDPSPEISHRESSPVEARISAAQANIKAKPNSFAAWNDLAFALCRKGRDTQDPTVYNQAEAALTHALQLSPGNYEARKLQAAVFLGRHEFTRALALATELNRKTPDDIAGWALLADANIGLGKYADAEKQVQWVLDLRPGNTLGFEKAAALRVLFGDVPGAIEFLDESIRRTSPNDADQHAWLLTEKARLELVSGYNQQAEILLQQALQLFPGSVHATEILARVRTASAAPQTALKR